MSKELNVKSKEYKDIFIKELMKRGMSKKWAEESYKNFEAEEYGEYSDPEYDARELISCWQD